MKDLVTRFDKGEDACLAILSSEVRGVGSISAVRVILLELGESMLTNAARCLTASGCVDRAGDEVGTGVKESCDCFLRERLFAIVAVLLRSDVTKIQ